MLLGGILLVVTDTGGGGGGTFRLDGAHWSGVQAAAIAALAAVACALGIAVFLFRCLLLVGFGTAVQRVMVSGTDEVGDLFRPRGRFLSMVLGSLLVAVIVVVAFLPFVVVVGAGFLVAGMGRWDPLLLLAVVSVCLAYAVIWGWIALGVSLVSEAVSIEGLGPIEALRRSWSLTAGNRLELFLYYLVLFLLNLVACACCCFPALVVGPWTWVTKYESYVRLTQLPPGEGLWIDGEGAASSRA